jgi:type IV pilus assembly protein PilV
MRNFNMWKEKGVGLVEVLVALLILSTALLALVSLQTRSLQFNHGAYMRSQANIFAYDIMERIRINNSDTTGTASVNPNLAAYNIALAPYPLNTPVVAAPLAAADLDQWRRAIATNLPNGQGSIRCDVGTAICTITIVWSESAASDLLDENSSTFVYGARL